MSDSSKIFDPYHNWLGIPPDQQPPHHYRLLGIELFEDDPDVIDIAANRQVAYLRQVGGGTRQSTATALAAEIGEARKVLISPRKRAKYDDLLRQQGYTVEAPEAPPVASSDATHSAASDSSTFNGIVVDDQSGVSRSSARQKTTAGKRSQPSSRPESEDTAKKAPKKTTVRLAAVGVGVASVAGMVAFLTSGTGETNNSQLASPNGKQTVASAADPRQRIDPLAQTSSNGGAKPAPAPRASSQIPRPKEPRSLDFQFANLNTSAAADPNKSKAGNKASSKSSATTTKPAAKPRPAPSKPNSAASPETKPSAVTTIDDAKYDNSWLKDLKNREDFTIDIQDLRFTAPMKDQYVHFDGKLFALKVDKKEWWGNPFSWIHELKAGQTFAMNFRLPKNMAAGTGVTVTFAGVQWILRVRNSTTLAIMGRFGQQKPVQLMTTPYAKDEHKLYTFAVSREKKNSKTFAWQLRLPAGKPLSGKLQATETKEGKLLMRASTRGTGASGLFIDNLMHGELKTPMKIAGKLLKQPATEK